MYTSQRDSLRLDSAWQGIAKAVQSMWLLCGLLWLLAQWFIPSSSSPSFISSLLFPGTTCFACSCMYHCLSICLDGNVTPREVWLEVLPSDVNWTKSVVRKCRLDQTCFSGMLVEPEMLTRSSYRKYTSRDKCDRSLVEQWYRKNACLLKIIEQLIERLRILT